MKLLDHLIKNYGFKNDREIALNMAVSVGTVSKIRTGKRKPSASIILKLHEKFGISIAGIKYLASNKS